MTHEEFMEMAEKEIQQILMAEKSELLNVMEQAWAEGKKNAENSELTEVVRKLIEKQNDNSGKAYALYDEPVLEAKPKYAVPKACRECSNHPSNGGSGICNCILGMESMRV